MFLVNDRADKLWIMNLDNLEGLRIKDAKSINPEEYIVECAMVSGKQYNLFKGNESECAAMVRILQSHLITNQDVLQMSQLIPDANGDVR